MSEMTGKGERGITLALSRREIRKRHGTYAEDGRIQEWTLVLMIIQSDDFRVVCLHNSPTAHERNVMIDGIETPNDDSNLLFASFRQGSSSHGLQDDLIQRGWSTL